MEKKQKTNKTSSKKSKRKNKVSSNTALFLSLAVLLLCVVMLALSFVFTQKTTSNPSSAPVVAKESSNTTTSKSVSTEKEKSSSVKIQPKENSTKTKVESSSSKQSEKSQSVKSQSVKSQSVKSQSVKSQTVKTETPKTTVANTTTQQNTVTQKTTPQKNSVQDSQSSVVVKENEKITTPTKKVADVYIVLDDGGHNLSHLKPFLDLKIPLTIAVLPNLAYSKQSANLTVQYGKNLILHQPMQAVNLSTDPGPNAIMPEMSAEQIRSLVSENIDSLGVKIGLNNHEGSLITADTFAMKAVMEVCKSRGMFFLDSRTNSQSVCKNVASEYGVKLYERNIFLDNTPNQSDMIAMFKSGIEYAKKNGSVVMIGHVWSGKNLADVLQKMYDEYYPQGFIFGELK